MCWYEECRFGEIYEGLAISEDKSAYMYQGCTVIERVKKKKPFKPLKYWKVIYLCEAYLSSPAYVTLNIVFNVKAIEKKNCHYYSIY